jgi:hypothetical protein
MIALTLAAAALTPHAPTRSRRDALIAAASMPVCFAARVAQASEEGEEQYRGKPGFDAEGRIIQSGTAAAYKAELAREAKRAIAEVEKVERLATLNAARAELRSKRSQEVMRTFPACPAATCSLHQSLSLPSGRPSLVALIEASCETAGSILGGLLISPADKSVAGDRER